MVPFTIRNLNNPHARRVARRVMRHMAWHSGATRSEYARKGYKMQDIPGVVWASPTTPGGYHGWAIA